MSRGFGSPLSFLLTGWTWLLLTSLVGLATFLGVVRGSPLPPASACSMCTAPSSAA